MTGFVVLFCIVGIALWGLPFYYDFMTQQFGWSRAQVTKGNALSKLAIGPVFGWIVERYGPRRLMMAGILLTGIALAGLGTISTLGMFYLIYVVNALGYMCGGPIPNQVPYRNGSTSHAPSERTHPRNPKRPQWEPEILKDCARLSRAHTGPSSTLLEVLVDRVGS
jgi:MFS family permease